MKHPWRQSLSLCWTFSLLLIPACTQINPATPTQSMPSISVVEIQENYQSYDGQLVRVRGYGVIMMTAPLCPGYVGMDTRLSFMGEAASSIYAVLTETAQGAERSESLREFQGYVRVYKGEIGCPGSVQNAAFPYFEVVSIK